MNIGSSGFALSPISRRTNLLVTLSGPAPHQPPFCSLPFHSFFVRDIDYRVIEKLIVCWGRERTTIDRAPGCGN